jgi:hypothetical protein
MRNGKLTFNASSLEAPDGFFEASDQADRKTIKLKAGQAFNYELFGHAVEAGSSSQLDE